MRPFLAPTDAARAIKTFLLLEVPGAAWRSADIGAKGLTARLTTVGQARGIDLLAYNPLTYRYYDMAGRLNAPGIAKGLIALFPEARTFCDVGAGTGRFVAEPAAQGQGGGGVRVVACGEDACGRPPHPPPQLRLGAG